MLVLSRRPEESIAIGSNITVVVLGIKGNQVRLGFRAPRDVVIDILGADAQWEGRRAVVRFEPDGASSGTVMRLSREGAGYEVRVNWFTGSVAVAQVEP